MPALESQITFLATTDLEGTDRFYTEILGLPLVLDQGSCRIYRITPGAYLGFCERKAVADPVGVIVTLVTELVEDWHAELLGRGVEFEKGPSYNEEYRITQCFLRDPNGYLIEIQRFEDPRWQE